jgi:hypothetical protein
MVMNNNMKCEIEWNTLSLDDWQARFKTIKQSNVLQSYSYARAACKANRQSARWGLIKIDGIEAGLVQILEAKILFGAFHAIILDRGPLWFDGFGGAAHISTFFDIFHQSFPPRFGRKRRIIPEMAHGIAVEKILTQCGLEKVTNQTPYETLWWDLEQDDERARENLKSNWRGALKKAEIIEQTGDIQVTWDDKGKFYPWLRTTYAVDKEIKGYSGVSPKLLDDIALFSTPDDPMIIGKVSQNKRDIAAVMFICHGQSATYQIGWSDEAGRKNNAHQLLLWQGRSVLRSHGIKQMDLGGVNDESAKTIKKFKQGTGAKALTLVGHYR